MVDGDWAGGKAIVVGVGCINRVGGIRERDVYEIHEIEVGNSGDEEIERGGRFGAVSPSDDNALTFVFGSHWDERAKMKGEYKKIAKK